MADSVTIRMLTMSLLIPDPRQRSLEHLCDAIASVAQRFGAKPWVRGFEAEAASEGRSVRLIGKLTNPRPGTKLTPALSLRLGAR